ncbi:MAG: anhydro-N-acetylmuramic acid kinase [Nitratireductor sp.]
MPRNPKSRKRSSKQKNDARLQLALGLMSGTSMDGIDVALLRTNGKSHLERLAGASFPYDPAFRKELSAALVDATAIERREDRPGRLAEIERELTIRHAAVVNSFLFEHRMVPADIDVIGFHGQTVLHRPEAGLTVQLGDGKLLARQTGINVVHDMRARDMEHGGQGAPLVPVYHRALSRNLSVSTASEEGANWPVAFVNIGGIANITWISARGAMIAFDTGPGNALVDQWVQAKAGIPYDQAGAIASEGRVLPEMVHAYLRSPFFNRAAPKSLDRNDFLPPDPASASLEDGARSLAHVTARSILMSAEHLPDRPALWIICGGGRHNRTIMDDLRQLAGESGMRVLAAEEAGFDGDSMEAEAWAYLAVRSQKGLKLTWPGTTGVDKPRSGGKKAKYE